MSRMHNPAHPGEVLREFLPKDLPVGEAARLGVSRQALSALLNGRAGVSAEMALRLEAALGTSEGLVAKYPDSEAAKLAARRLATLK